MDFKKIIFLSLCIQILVYSGCKKAFLDQKPSSDIIQPTTLEEFQLLLENMEVNNATSALPMLAADEYEYISYPIWQSARNATERNSYIWEKDLFGGQVDFGDWNTPYKSIFYTNNILNGLENISPSQNSAKYRLIKGWALFGRAYAYFDLARNFCAAYDPGTSGTDLGLPLRLRPSVDLTLQRSSLGQTYTQILSDLTQATALLDVTLPAARNHPSRPACHALFARIYLSMRDYAKAEKHSDSCLSLYNKLIDYSTISPSSATPFAQNNDELLFPTSTITGYPNTTTTTANASVSIPAAILQLYGADDLRPGLYFSRRTDGSYIRKRGYAGIGLYPFTGLATDETYLIKAECAVRNGNVQASLTVLNALISKRFPKAKFSPVAISDPVQLLQIILLERRKELIWRCLRWDDLKRLNREGAGIILTRTLNGQQFTLQPNDPRYVFPIPDNEISLSGIEQNIR